MSGTGIKIQAQYPAEVDVTVWPSENETWPPKKLHRELYDAEGSALGQRLLESVRSVGRQAASVANLYQIFEEAGVDAIDGGYLDICRDIANGYQQAEFDLLRITRQLGGQTSHDIRTGFEDVLSSDPAVFAAADVTPTIVIPMEGFERVRREQRQDVLALVRAYARGCRVVLVAGPIERTFLWRQHQKELPASVKDDCKPRLGVEGDAAAVRRAVEDARDALDHDSKPVQILRLLDAENSDTLTYSALASKMGVKRGTIRNHVSQRLKPQGLVDRFDHLDDRNVSLTHVGKRFLETLDSEIGIQRSLLDCVKDTGKRCDDSRVTPPAHEGRPNPMAEAEATAGTSADRNRLPRYHQVRSAARHRYAAAAGSATDGGVTLVDHPIGKKSDRGEPHWYYDDDADRLLVGAEYDDPMQWWVCIALALADARTFRHVLTAERLESEKLGDLLANHTDLLRNSRCLGYLADADATGEGYADALQEAAENLRELTRDLNRENYDDRNRFRGLILREALGLAGTIVHLLDLADVEFVREARLPRFSKDFDAGDEADLAKTIATGAAIQSRYGEFAAYRQLFEPRKKKREGTFPPTVSADDPFGQLIGSFVLVGRTVGRDGEFGDVLRRRLSNPADVHENAPEFAVRIPVRTPQRRHYAQTAREIFRRKDLLLTREAVSMLAALTGSPYDVARALHSLAPETKVSGRRVRLDEVRFALSTLDPKRILSPMNKPALSKIAQTLLVAGKHLNQSELAARAGVSKRSVRNHRELLEAFGLVRNTDAGYRFALPFHTDEERGETVLPWFVTTDDDPADSDTYTRDVLSEVVFELLDTHRYSDPDDPVGGALFAGPGEVVSKLRAAWEWLDPWIKLVHTLLDRSDRDLDGEEPTRSATFGVRPKQTSLDATTKGAA